MTMTRRAILAASLALPSIARAQWGGWAPDRPVSLIVPFAAGGPTDVIARLVAEGMGKDLGQAVVVENVTGAGGTIAAARVANARPDGGTLLFHHIGHASAATLYRKLPYDVQESFAPLGLASDAAMTIVARPDFPASDLAGVLMAMKRDGDKLTLAHSGLGAANHLCGMLLQHAAGTALTSVVFRGSAPAITELMAGRIDVFCGQATNTVPFLREGRIKGYAVTLDRRVPGLDLPTTAEAGQPSLLMSTWHGMYAPKPTPPEARARLSQALQAALREERLKTRLAELVTEPASQEHATEEYHTRFLAEEVARWRPIIQAAGQYAD
jgi:tripartite-type tricarboxylate transporter receptor subunit TctC